MEKAKTIFGGTVERGKVIAVTDNGYRVASLDREGIVTPEIKAAYKTDKYTVGEIVYFLYFRDGTGKILYDINGQEGGGSHAETADNAKHADAADNATHAETADNALSADTAKAITDAVMSNLLNRIYPVGSIYTSVNGTSPADLFGGTWEAISGRFLIGVGAVEANNSTYWGNTEAGQVNNPAGETGGEAWHTLTVDQMPYHGHNVHLWNKNNETGYAQKMNANGSAFETAAAGAYIPAGVMGWSNTSFVAVNNGYGDISGVTNMYGGGVRHNNMPPYLTVYMWKRIA